MQAILRFLDLVRRDLAADDVRAEIGGREPTNGVWTTLPSGLRVVALFEAMLSAEEIEKKKARLAGLAETFVGMAAAQDIPSASPRPSTHELDDALAVLASRARAERALVIDESSPEIWGSSESPREHVDVEHALWLTHLADHVAELGEDFVSLLARDRDALNAHLLEKGFEDTELEIFERDLDRLREMGAMAVDPMHLRAMRAIAAVRGKEHGVAIPEGHHILLRNFANIYRLVLVFGGPFSELRSEGAVIHALPVIERLVVSLPPRDPVGAGAKVAVLRRLRRV